MYRVSKLHGGSTTVETELCHEAEHVVDANFFENRRYGLMRGMRGSSPTETEISVQVCFR